MAYNSSHTGQEIDNAVTAVQNKETTWDGKQNKLTGTQGQIVGFDSSGNAVAQEAPDTGVVTFNGRTGAVTPQSGDYTAEMVGALSQSDVLSISNGGTGVSSMTGTDYTTNRPRGIVLQSTEPDTVPNGCLVGVYE